MRAKEETRRIVMAVTNDLVTDRRVMRHAEALRDAGYEVLVIGRNDLELKHSRGWLFYAEYNLKLFRRLKEESLDVVWANDTDTLLGSWLAAKGWRRSKAKLVMDAHELFPEVPEIQHKPLVKWVWRTIEHFLMPKCDALLTVCQSIADYYKKKYDVEMAVVRNVSGVTELQGDKVTEKSSQATQSLSYSVTQPLKTLLYQGCVNKGRGVDWAIEALEWLEDCRLVIAGGGDLLEEMKAYAAQKPWADRIIFLGRLKPDDLGPLTCQASVGLVMLEDIGLSYHYALPNRIGDFVAAGVPIVVSDLPEMAAVVRKYGVGEVIEGEQLTVKGERRETRALAEAVKKVLAREWGEEDFTEARKDMDWNNEKQKLIEIIEKI